MSVGGLEVTDVIIFPIRKKLSSKSLVAFARVIINDQFLINGIRIFTNDDETFVKFPVSYNDYDIVSPITAELRNYIIDQVLSQYSLTLMAEEIE